MVLINFSLAKDNSDMSCDKGPENKHTQEKAFSRIFIPYATIIWNLFRGRARNPFSLPKPVDFEGSKSDNS